MDQSNIGTNREILMNESYKDSGLLDIRIRAHVLYSEPKVNFFEWVLDKIDWKGTELVIDIGCGSGGYANLTSQHCETYIAGDLSYGMVKPLSDDYQTVNLDAQTLPFQSNQADIILANHMLYHVPDRKKAVQSIHQVLKPGGKLVAATNAQSSGADIGQLRAQSAINIGLSPEIGSFHFRSNFDLESGRELLEPYFSEVKLHELDSWFVFPNPEEVMAYTNSSKAWHEKWVEPFMPAGKGWPDYEASMRAILDKHFETHDSFRVSKKSGVFVCTK